MPDRIIRADILTSGPVNQLSWPAEVFYRRLMSVADDYGRYEGRPSILRAALYPLQLDKVSEPDIVKWLDESSKAGLVRKYTVDAKEYIEISKFQQRLRAMKSKYPAPADSRRQLPTDDSRCQPEEKRGGDGFRNRNEEESEGKSPRDCLLADRGFMEKILMNWRLTDEQLGNMLNAFDLHLTAESKKHNAAEYKKHFHNWGAKRFTEFTNGSSEKAKMHY